MTEPTTKAGRALVRGFHSLREAAVAIEAEARAQERERIHRAALTLIEVPFANEQVRAAYRLGLNDLIRTPPRGADR